ncbi:hypothetical protein VC83_04964 [Pseudogymnoascus destructans]|uniref:Uncharacterized protein n=1 Tax=Pseudogymnoascus destructans TaxID=655981 RepID=A0A177ABB1_9PEZI|nr:uncharacterized protein VC83_04964 [Pseudogymnoascus destructans]OAF58541.1 hypothetical protein VC83_04964 [Pseudogymnoascus destructans]
MSRKILKLGDMASESVAIGLERIAMRLNIQRLGQAFLLWNLRKGSGDRSGKPFSARPVRHSVADHNPVLVGGQDGRADSVSIGSLADNLSDTVGSSASAWLGCQRELLEHSMGVRGQDGNLVISDPSEEDIRVSGACSKRTRSSKLGKMVPLVHSCSRDVHMVHISPMARRRLAVNQEMGLRLDQMRRVNDDLCQLLRSFAQRETVHRLRAKDVDLEGLQATISPCHNRRCNVPTHKEHILPRMHIHLARQSMLLNLLSRNRIQAGDLDVVPTPSTMQTDHKHTLRIRANLHRHRPLLPLNLPLHRPRIPIQPSHHTSLLPLKQHKRILLLSLRAQDLNIPRLALKLITPHLPPRNRIPGIHIPPQRTKHPLLALHAAEVSLNTPTRLGLNRTVRLRSEELAPHQRAGAGVDGAQHA